MLSKKKSKLSEKKLNNAYLGFVVIKPLPETIIGRTCLTIYEDDPKRKYPITRKYKANLFGIHLTVNKTIAFQEQDSVVSACATSALWSAFQGTGILFQHKIPSPVQITSVSDGVFSSNKNRTFPNSNLKPEMMAKAIRHVGLEPYSKDVTFEHDELIHHLYAYLKCGIPVILGVHLFDTTKSYGEDGYKNPIKHAVAVTGFKLGKDKAAMNSSGLLTTASRINKIYVHDDQVGPFARMAIDDEKLLVQKIDNKEVYTTAFSTSHPNSKGRLTHVKAIPDLIMIPHYHKIRIPYEQIELAINIFGHITEEALPQLPKHSRNNINLKFEWDIYLTTVNAYKSDLFNSKVRTSFYDTLTKGLPHYLWRASACVRGRPVIDFLFDATDIEQGSFFIQPIFYREDLKKALVDLFQNTNIKKNVGKEKFELLQKSQGWHIVKWFKDYNY